MPRPYCPRRIGFTPGVTYFKPAGIPLRLIGEISLSPDELEALRLADLEGKYQEDGARQMGVSRQTFGRIIESARKKVAEALVKGMALRLEMGGRSAAARYRCCRGRCRHSWWVSSHSSRPSECPSCGGKGVALTGESEFKPPSAPLSAGAFRNSRRRCCRNRDSRSRDNAPHKKQIK